jgi:hypothetical protein
VSPVHYADKEKEYLSIFAAKKKYFLATNKKEKADFTSDDSVNVSRMSPKDSLFVKYMRDHTKDNLLFTVQDLSKAFIGPSTLEKMYERLKYERQEAFMKKFHEADVAGRVKLKKDESKTPYNGFSYFRISYNGDIPEEMKEAFNALDEYDNESPRKKLKEERKKTRRFFNAK